MAYPPASLPTNATDGASPSDTTPTAVLTAAEVNATNAAVNDIVTELGSNPSGTDTTVAARLDGIESDITALGSGSIPDGSVSTAKLANGAVTAAKVAADVATQAELDAETAARTAAIAGLSGTYARKVADWATGVAYSVGELVVSSGTLYRCTTVHTAGGSFAGGNFTAIGGGGSTVTVDADGTLVVNGTTVELSTDAETSAAVGGSRWFRYPSGYWAGPSWYGVMDSNSFAPVLGRLYAAPFAVDVATPILGIGCNVAAAAGGSFVRLGVFEGDPMPGNLVAGSDSGQISTASGGSAQFSYGSSITLPPGIYWLTLVAQSVAAGISFANSSGSRMLGIPCVPGDASWAGVPQFAAGVSSVATSHTAGLPSTFGAAVTSTANFAAAPMVRVKV